MIYTVELYHRPTVFGRRQGPYTDGSLSQLDTVRATNFVATIKAIAQVVEKHGLRVSWNIPYGAAKGICEFQKGETQNIYQQLKAAGHEIGIYGPGITRLNEVKGYLVDVCKVTPTTQAAFMKAATSSSDPQNAVAALIAAAKAAGVSVGTINISQNGDPSTNPFGPICPTIGEGNDMSQEASALLFPWRPGYMTATPDICVHVATSDFTLVDHIHGTWLPKKLMNDTDFDSLLEKLDGALTYVARERPTRIGAWGFPSHMTEYMDGTGASTSYNSGALDALDRFLTRVDEYVKAGTVVYSTPSEIVAKTE